MSTAAAPPFRGVFGLPSPRVDRGQAAAMPCRKARARGDNSVATVSVTHTEETSLGSRFRLSEQRSQTAPWKSSRGTPGSAEGAWEAQTPAGTHRGRARPGFRVSAGSSRRPDGLSLGRGELLRFCESPNPEWAGIWGKGVQQDGRGPREYLSPRPTPAPGGHSRASGFSLAAEQRCPSPTRPGQVWPRREMLSPKAFIGNRGFKYRADHFS